MRAFVSRGLEKLILKGRDQSHPAGYCGAEACSVGVMQVLGSLGRDPNTGLPQNEPNTALGRLLKYWGGSTFRSEEGALKSTYE